jgi:hypothetical protein
VRRHQPASAALAGLAFFLQACVAAAQDDMLAELPDGPGKEETFYTCNACHSFRLVAQQGLSRQRWDHLLDWMVEEQGMAELEADERTLILDYLVEHYGQGGG